MRVARGRLHLSVTEQLADHREALAERQRPRSKAVPEVMDPHVLQLGTLADASPGALEISAWLPAGAHAEAIVLAGVDASAGVSSQGDPRPVLLRIVGPAWTAAEDGEAMQVDVDGCTVTDKEGNDRAVTEIVVAGAQGTVNILSARRPDPDPFAPAEATGQAADTGNAATGDPGAGSGAGSAELDEAA